jgi:Protein of unknown function (DUF3499)
MNSGTSWARRQGSRYRRLCARPGCGAPAATTLRFEPTLRQAWLVDLDESAARTQGDLCHRHAEALVLPSGWKLHDERSDASSRRVDTPAERASERSPRRVRVRRRASTNGSSPEHAPSQLPGFEPVVVPTNGHASPDARVIPAQFGANDDDLDTDDDALSAILDARTPLLRRAFRNAKPEEPDS